MKLVMHPKANVPVSIGEYKSTLAVHLGIGEMKSIPYTLLRGE